MIRHVDRVIPTCVGKTPPYKWAGYNEPGHPHVCGENFFERVHPIEVVGSSPRVWGKLESDDNPAMQQRVIPTCVGKTCVAADRAQISAGHPHVCGENRQHRCQDQPRPGSSPRVWGKRKMFHGGGKESRVIPTCVGKTLYFWFANKFISGHPHVCGENSSIGVISSAFTGSSPRVWGKQAKERPCARHHRVIPTCVGKTEGTSRTISCTPGHPHVCGENRLLDHP